MEIFVGFGSVVVIKYGIIREPEKNVALYCSLEAKSCYTASVWLVQLQGSISQVENRCKIIKFYELFYPGY